MRTDKAITLREIIREHLRDERWGLFASILCATGYTLTELAAPWPLKIIFDHILLGRPWPPSLAWLGGLTNSGTTFAIVVISLSLIFIAAFRGLFAYFQTYITSRLGHELVYRLRRELFAHLQQLSLSYHARARTGELLTKVVGDTTALKDVFAESALNLSSHLLTIIGTVIVMFALDW